MSYKLTEKDVDKVLIRENIINYTEFVYSSYKLIFSRLGGCCRKMLNKETRKHMQLYEDGEKRIMNALDVCKIVKNNSLLHLMKHL